MLLIMRKRRNRIIVLESLSEIDLPSVIVLDLNMPKLNGTQILKMLKANRKLKILR
jgi:CheY-like chemotaxis protein